MQMNSFSSSWQKIHSETRADTKIVSVAADNSLNIVTAGMVRVNMFKHCLKFPWKYLLLCLFPLWLLQEVPGDVSPPNVTPLLGFPCRTIWTTTPLNYANKVELSLTPREVRH